MSNGDVFSSVLLEFGVCFQIGVSCFGKVKEGFGDGE